MTVVYILVVIATLGLIGVASSVRVVQQFERGVVFRFGQVRDATRGPGLAVIAPIVDRLHKVNMQIVTHADSRPGRHHPGQRHGPGRRRRLLPGRRPGAGDCRRPGLRLRDPSGGAGLAAFDHRQERAGRPAVQPGAAQPGPGADDRQPGGRLGRAHRPGGDQGRGAARVHEAVDVSAGRSGARTPLPRDHRRRGAAGLAEARRGRRGDDRTSRCLQLRLLQTVVEVAAEKNSTLVLPFPVELLRFLERSTPADPAGSGGESIASSARPDAPAGTPTPARPPATDGRLLANLVPAHG